MHSSAGARYFPNSSKVRSDACLPSIFSLYIFFSTTYSFWEHYRIAMLLSGWMTFRKCEDHRELDSQWPTVTFEGQLCGFVWCSRHLKDPNQGKLFCVCYCTKCVTLYCTWLATAMSAGASWTWWMDAVSQAMAQVGKGWGRLLRKQQICGRRHRRVISQLSTIY